ncbi:fatty acid hydroxylase family protein [Oleomonas cavernae]|uniref:Fatty acid hydroxylase family protein n=1 Tax=Oleomonas cavernae TaxID=2320859 RepID=A0A418WSY4_9PROT|nr:sterol desaturase family protein [Oleomonas cavernae]RJF94364.1 fatty acid hydroxylase family protein [Oleomonas cavernae]
MEELAQIAAILGVYAAFVVVEYLAGRFTQPKARPGDGLIELISTLTILLVTIPAIYVAGAALTEYLAPGSHDALAALNPLLMFAILLVADDMSQYWWHRTAHRVPWLYQFHRAHHEAQYMSIRITYRNNLLYYLFMPGLWASAVLVYLGFGEVYAIYGGLKMLVIFGAHSSVRWDEPLYRHRWLHPVAWVVERVISTPATHAAHHGLTTADGVTNYKGNYGNLLFFWDVLFRTAKITRRYPTAYGIENLAPVDPWQQIFYPFVRRKASHPAQAIQPAE